ncbi:Tc toxin subunit A [Pseudomonas gozinkensis]|uniref:Tc toxin subunit A n=1 Tax=Pseudomonas gozinkensis TaxID=2774461 RepID=UPI0017885811|nr:Tc toxin subunit A [Pseudomonas gozinkensis]
MAKIQKRPAEQMYERLFATTTRRKKYPGLHTYLNKGGSIFPLVDMGESGLVKQYRMTAEDAKAFMRAANSMAIYIKRQYIEAILTGDVHKKTARTPKNKGSSGSMRSMVDGPSYEKLFQTDFGSLCPPRALESLWSPVAYLVALFEWISKRIEPVGDIPADFLLHKRRVDLRQLMIDNNAVYRSVSAVEIINRVLEQFIAEHGSDEELVGALIQARYLNDLPYYKHWVALDTIARNLEMSVGNFVHKVDHRFPYFLEPDASSAHAARALAHASRMGPYQRTLLTEPAPPFEERAEFYDRNYGTDNTDKHGSIIEVQFFAQQTILSLLGLESVLAIRTRAPVRSPNVKFDTASPVAAESERFGAVYINAATSPPINITEGDSLRQTMTLDPDEKRGFDHLDRLNRKVRLDKWLNLPSHETDALLVAAINAEVLGGAELEKCWITDHVVHALGLFQLLRERYGCTALDFAAMLHLMPVYGIENELSLFDQIFNRRGGYGQPFVLDGESFPAIPATGSTDLTVNQLCSALQIDLMTYVYLALVIAKAQNLGDSLRRDAAVVSAFYRLVKLARLVSITPVELVLMLTLLGGDKWLDGLAGLPVINPQVDGVPDALNLIYAVHSFASWCKERNLQVSWVLQMLVGPQPGGTASEPELQLIEKVDSLLSATLLTDAGFQRGGVPSAVDGNWLNHLTALADANGLIKDISGSEAEYLETTRFLLGNAVKDGLPAMDDPARAAIVEKMLLVLLQARDAQVSVVREALAVLTGLESELVLQVLFWADASVYQLLSKISGRLGNAPQNVRQARNIESDPLLKILANVQRLGSVVKTLGLSADVLREFLDYGSEAWLGQNNKYEFSISTLYYLATLTRAFDMSDQSPKVLLDYLHAINDLKPDINGDSLRLAQEAGHIILASFFSWSVEDVRECISHMGADLKILKDLRQLDLLMRVHTLAKHSGMDARTIFQVGTLPENTDRQAYAAAAERALLSQTEDRVPDLQLAGEVEQLLTMTCTVDNTEVVANKPGAKITYTVTLKDANGAPLKGVRVFWKATLGTIATKTTDVDGVVEAEFIPGTQLGIDTPYFWLDLFKPVNAPTIHVGSDAETLEFRGPLTSVDPLGPVPQGEEAQLYSGLTDKYKNPGPNRLVEWSAIPAEGSEDKPFVIRPSAQTYTDQQGQTKVFVSAPEGGTCTFEVRNHSNDKSIYFGPIIFEPAT